MLCIWEVFECHPIYHWLNRYAAETDYFQVFLESTCKVKKKLKLMVHTQFTWLRPGIAAFSIEFRIVREQNEGNLSDSARVAPFHF